MVLQREQGFKEACINHFKVFDELLLHSEPEQVGSIVWLDLTSYPDISESEVKLLLDFIENFDQRPDKKAEIFNGIESFKIFEVIARKTRLDEKFDMKMIKEEVFKQHQILVLIDIGGSILYRSGEKLMDVDRSCDYQVKKHFHYYRPFYDDYIKGLIEHPRVKLGIYTSIMRKNVMPLLFKIFEGPKLRAYKSKVFEVFDQEYNMPDVQPTKPIWATKRSLNRVLDHPKVQKEGFTLERILMIDSDPDKVRDNLDNSLVCKEYTYEEVKNPKEDQNKILMEVRDFVIKMLEETDNVQEYLQLHKPEHLKGNWSNAASPEEKSEESKEVERDAIKELTEAVEKLDLKGQE